MKDTGQSPEGPAPSGGRLLPASPPPLSRLFPAARRAPPAGRASRSPQGDPARAAAAVVLFLERFEGFYL